MLPRGFSPRANKCPNCESANSWMAAWVQTWLFKRSRGRGHTPGADPFQPQIKVKVLGVLGDDYVGAYPGNFPKSPNAKELRIIYCWVSGSFLVCFRGMLDIFLDGFGEDFLGLLI